MEVIRVASAREIEIAVERPKPKKEDRKIAELLFLPIMSAARIRRIKELVEQHASTLIFVNTRETAEMLASKLKVLAANVSIHHSSISKEERIAVEEEFKKGRIKALVCTSSLELGIDIGSVDLVIQYSSPRQVSRLLQRIGRSGHKVGKKAKGIIIAGESDDILESLVVAKFALEERLEKIKMHVKPLDVLAHQIAGILLERRLEGKSMTREELKKEIFSIVSSSFVFSGLNYEEFEEVFNFMEEMRLLRGERLREYYYGNLSTIPDEKKYLVRDIISRKAVGVLDESFVASLDYGNLIIFKAMPWRVINLENSEILVEPVTEIAGEIPSWVGEEIPVEYEVAREVGRLRRTKNLASFNCDDYTKRLALSTVKRQEKLALPLPSDALIFAEIARDTCVINACLGKKINEALGRAFSIFIALKTSHSAELKVDPYRIILRSPDMSVKLIEEIFSMSEDDVEALLRTGLKRTSLFKYKFIQIARRFGAISKEISLSTLGLDRLISAYESTPVYKETLREIFTDNLDLEGAKRAIKDIKEKKLGLKISRVQRLSPLSAAGFNAASEFILPERAEKIILTALKNRILKKRIHLFCTYCASWKESFLVSSISSDIACKNCGAKMLAVLNYDADNVTRVFKKHRQGKKLPKEEKELLKKYQLAANLFLSYGSFAAIALSARGVGPETAKRILQNSKTEEELMRNILRSEKNYAKTRKFWD